VKTRMDRGGWPRATSGHCLSGHALPGGKLGVDRGKLGSSDNILLTECP
jgi:hypothetical protein